jgi:hypothetical protein
LAENFIRALALSRMGFLFLAAGGEQAQAVEAKSDE